MFCAQILFIVSLSFFDHNTAVQSDVSIVPQTKLDVLATLWAEDVVTLGEETTANQGHRALLTVEAVIVPLALLKRNVLAASEA